ncbi:MAG: 4-(cytidine 5'-diphospho)-2-C-methyl-D-erythritol kinase [Lachnospiraceae bacterium]|nr:4-(cytidine 5'-diphospho)-2-C-methyl-D-erythritol kinase [Lachnospiraceae bacterium]
MSNWANLILPANAKINLGLDVLGVRPDGYHEVRMVMQSLALHDDIGIGRNDENRIIIKCDSDKVPLDESNLCHKAARLMIEEYGISGGITVTINKRIPVAAGLAGGSADAAAALVGINEIFSLGLSGEELRDKAVRLGADVPYCIFKKTALSEGIGERLTELAPLPPCQILLFTPDIPVPTASVYKKLDQTGIEAHPDIDGMLAALKDGDLKRVASLLGNVLEAVTMREHPIISVVKEKMKEFGALGALMSGSGPTVFGIFADPKEAGEAYTRLKHESFKGQLLLTDSYSAAVF